MTDLLVCEASDEIRAALRRLLSGHDELAVVGEAANGEDAVALALALAPDVVLIGSRLPIVDGVDATRRIKELLPTAGVVAFTDDDDLSSATALIDAGADGYCVRGAPLWELERALAVVRDPLARLAHGLARARNRAGIGTIVSRELLELTGACVVAAYVTSPDVSLSLTGLAGAADAAPLATAPGLALRSFSTLGCAHADGAELRELERLGVTCRDALAVPLVSDGEALGSLLVAMPAADDLVADEDLVSNVAALAAAAFAAERRLALTHAEARRDALTGLANRRAFDERLDAAIGASSAGSRRFSLVLFDLDGFKRVNDAGGHAAGDAVLRQVGRAAQRVLRSDDELYRIGGDEFAMLVDGGPGLAARVAGRITAALAEQTRGGLLPAISTGVATYPDDAQTADGLAVAADNALYSAKWRGAPHAVPTRPRGGSRAGARGPAGSDVPAGSRSSARVLFVDDDPAFLTLLRTTFELVDIEIDQAGTAPEAAAAIAARVPDVVVLDVGLPGEDGLSFCRRLKQDPATSWIGVVLLTGATDLAEGPAREAGADALLGKPFSPLELLAVVERLAGGLDREPFERGTPSTSGEQLLVYAGDVSRLLEIERGRRELLQRTYRQTVAALAGALESKDVSTALHSQRVQRYAVELAQALDATLPLEDRSVEYGFLLHDVGKIAIPDHVLHKPGPLTTSEQRLMRTHTVLGEQLLRDVDLLHGEGLGVVRWHHERWDGRGYPDRLSGTDVPLAARVFAVADALDAITSKRSYHGARRWDEAAAEIVAERGRQFDPDVVDAFRQREQALRAIRGELTLT